MFSAKAASADGESAVIILKPPHELKSTTKTKSDILVQESKRLLQRGGGREVQQIWRTDTSPSAQIETLTFFH